MHDGIEFAGYLSFLGLIALFPFLVFYFALVGYIGNLEVGTSFVNLLIHNLPKDVATAIKPRIDELTSGPPPGLLTISILGVIWTASSAVEGLRTVLNRAYRVNTPPAYVWRRLMSILQFILMTGLIVLVMLSLIVAPIVLGKLQVLLQLDLALLETFEALSYRIGTLLLFILVASAYYFLPNIKQRFFAVIPGALLVVGMWIGAVTLFSAYLRNFDRLNIIYGSLEGIIATLLFFFIMVVIFIYGAEVNYQLEKSLGHKLEPREDKNPASKPRREADF